MTVQSLRATRPKPCLYRTRLFDAEENQGYAPPTSSPPEGDDDDTEAENSNINNNINISLISITTSATLAPPSPMTPFFTCSVEDVADACMIRQQHSRGARHDDELSPSSSSYVLLPRTHTPIMSTQQHANDSSWTIVPTNTNTNNTNLTTTATGEEHRHRRHLRRSRRGFIFDDAGTSSILPHLKSFKAGARKKMLQGRTNPKHLLARLGYSGITRRLTGREGATSPVIPALLLGKQTTSVSGFT